MSAWIKCSERMPRESGSYMVFKAQSHDYPFGISDYCEKSGGWWTERYLKKHKSWITHWMPLPAPPEGAA